ncbi:MAG: sugar phosphate isomerase/epimerase family protein [Gemmobacter sp.]
MTRRLSLAHLSAIDLAPPDLIRAAAAAGFDAVGLRLLRVTPDSPGYPLMDDPAALRATQAALAGTGIAVSDIEFLRITPDTDPAALGPMLDTGAALGAGHLICAPYDDDRARLADRLGAVHEMCRARGMAAVLEFFPWTPVPDLAAARAVVQAAGEGVGILVDALHFDRSESSLELLASIPPDRLPFAHLCDARRHPPYDTAALLHTARQDRLPPGEGQIDLTALLAALPPGVPLGVEVPMPVRLPRPEHLRRLRDAAARFA